MNHGAAVQAGSPLALLADRAGIGLSYHDWQGQESPVAEESLVALLGVLGLPAETGEAITGSLEFLDREAWLRPLAPVAVASADAEKFDVSLVVPEKVAGEEFSWLLELEDGGHREGRFVPAHLPGEESRDVDGETLTRRSLRLPAPPMGYHRLRVEGPGLANGRGSEQTVIAAPDRCWQPDDGGGRRHRWGVAVQLYGLRSPDDWGVGDFGGLAMLAEEVARFGVSLIGVNPLHALHPRQGGNSPYFPSHRLFLNPIYIDVPAVPEFAGCAAAQRLVGTPGFQSRIADLRRSELVDYDAVSAAKLAVLEELYTEFRATHLAGGEGTPTSDRGRAFRDFQKERGTDLRRYAVFEALVERIGLDSPWHQWPEGVRRPDGDEIAEFERDHLERIEFFEYLQWETERQLLAAGSDVGLYGDLALGTAADGGEAWAYQECLAFGVRVGAPPDAFNQLGQDWGFPPFNPRALRDRAYRPFAEALRATMRPCGAVRIDHVMGLSRLYWIPGGVPPTDGAYVGYPLDDLLAVVRLESHRNRCLVVGEDLGTVPEGFREHLADSGLLSYRVLYFERAWDGGFIAPEHYPAQALATVSTHDLPTLAGYWSGGDLDEKARLELFPSIEAEAAARNDRAGDVTRLRDYLSSHGGLRSGDQTGEPSHRELAEAVLRVLAKTPCRLTLVQIEDLIGVAEQANMPGTTHQHPNWQRRLPEALPDLLRDPVFAVLREIAAE